MGLLGFLQFLVKYSVDVIAWPLLALAFPLFASITAIESNSFADSQKLNTYWVVFSLILLLEHVLSLFQWFPFWHYLRLIIVCLLVIPYFDGAFYVYKQLTSSLPSMDAQIIINWFNKPKEASAETQKILAKVEKYVRENGAEALEEIIADKSGSLKDPDVKEIKAVPSIDNEVVNQPNSNEPYVARKSIKAVEEIGKNEVKAAMLSGSTKDPDVKETKAVPSIDNEVVNQPNSNEPYVARKGIKAAEEIGKNEVKATMLSGSKKDLDVKEIKAVPSIDNEVVNRLNSNEPYVARKGIKAVEEIGKNEVKVAMLSGSTKDPDVKEIKAVPSIENEVVNRSGSTKDPDVKEIKAVPSIDNEVVNQPNSKGPYVARKGIKAVEDIEKNEVKAAMLSGSTKDPDVKEIKAVPSIDNEVVNEATSNGPNVARKDIQAVEEIGKNEVKAAMQVRVEPEVTRTTNITTLPSETREKFYGVQTGGELPQTPVSNIVQRNWECAICKKTFNSLVGLDSHLRGKKHKRKMDKAVKAKNETFSPKTYDDSAVEDQGRSSNNQTVFPKVIFSHIPKQFDQSTYSPGNISNVSTSGWEPSVTSGGQSDRSTYWPGNISNASSSGWEPSVISGGQSGQSTCSPGNIFNVSSSGWESGGQPDQSTYSPGNISNVSSSGWEPSVISGGQSDQSTYWPGNTFNVSSSGWEPSVISGGQSDQSTCSPGNISNVSSSGWEPSVIAGERFQGKPKNVVPGEKPMNQKKVTVGPNDSSLWCEICNVWCSGEANMKAHRGGKKHLTQVRSLAKK